MKNKVSRGCEGKGEEEKQQKDHFDKHPRR
jgi:hypothetical protein